MRKSTTGQSDKSKIIITPTLHPHCFTVFPHYCVWRKYQYSLKAQRGKKDRYPIVPSDEGTYEWLEGQMALLVSTTMVSCGKGWQRRGKSGAILPLI